MTGNLFRRLRWFLFAAVAAKAVWLAQDASPRFIVGDSVVYLQTAISGAIPPDRSFLYGYLLRVVAVWPGSLLSAILVQSLAGIVSALLLGYLLVRFLRVRAPVAGVLTVLCAVDPSQLLFERYLLTETFCLLLLSLYITSQFHYLQKPRPSLIFISLILGISLAGFRLVTLPLVASTAVLAPLLADRSHSYGLESPSVETAQTGRARWPGRRALLDMLIAVGVFLALSDTYRNLNGYLSQRQPAFSYADGFFLAAAWSPILQSGDAPSVAALEALEASRRLPPDPSPAFRNRDRWADNGLVGEMLKRESSPAEANRTAKRMAINAALRDPFGLLGLAWTTYSGFFDSGWYEWVMSYDIYHYVPEGLARILQEHFSTGTEDLPSNRPPTEQYYRSSRPYFLVVASSPLLAFIVWVLGGWDRSRYLALITAAMVSLSSMIALAALYASFRYLHQLSWFSLLIFGVLVERVMEQVSVKHSRRNPAPRIGLNTP